MPLFNGKVNIEYLDKSSQVLNPVKKQSYDIIHVSQGNRVLDVGCGPGIDVIEMGKILDCKGLVVGVDHDMEMLKIAKQRTHSMHMSDVTDFFCCDVTLLPFAADYFDSCRSERLFMHLPDPQQALAEMRRVTRPGGKVVVVDTDWTSLSVDCQLTKTEQLLKDYRINNIFTNGYSGRSLYRLFRQNDFCAIKTQVIPLFSNDLKLFYHMSAQQAVENQALADNVVSDKDLQLWRDQLLQAAAENSFYCCVNMVMVSAMKPVRNSGRYGVDYILSG